MSVAAEKQWRIDLAHHLKGARLQFRRYTRWSDSWDHDHCEACSIKFAEFEGAQIEHEGYTTCADYKHGAGYAWVCKTCFEDLKDDMQWILVAAENPRADPTSSTAC